MSRTAATHARAASAGCALFVCIASAPAAHAQTLAVGSIRADAASGSSIAWGAPHDKFWLHLPHDGVAAPLPTTVEAACDAGQVVFRIQASGERGDSLKAPQVRRDQVLDDQDHVTVYLDATASGSSAMFVRVGAGGSVSDGIYYASSNRQDTQPDFDVEASAERTANGYSVTLKIPRSSLPTQGRQAETMTYLVLRNVPGQSRQVFASAPLPTNTSNLMGASQPLDTTACGNPLNQQSFGATYTVTGDETRAAGRDRDYDSEFGASYRWSNGNTSSVDLTYNPDFSQVELDVPQLQSNALFAINLPEKREFFLRDIDLFELPTRGSLNDGAGNQAFYSRTITDPDWGGRFAYRSRGRDLAVLAASDNGGGMVALPGPFFSRFVAQPSSQVGLVRAAMNATPSFRYGAIAASRRYDGGFGDNSMIGVDAVWQPNDIWRTRAMFIGSRTSTRPDRDGPQVERRRSGSYLFWDFISLGRQWETAWTAERASKEFRNDVGYTPQADFTQVAGLLIRRWRPHGAVNNIGLSFKAIGADTTSTGETINRKFAPGIWFGGAHDLDLLIEYVPDQRRRTSGYGGRVHTTDQWNFRLGGNINRVLPWITFSLNVGDQIDYELDRVGSGQVVSLQARVRPLEWLELQPTLSHYRVEHPSLGKRIEETTGQIVANAILSPSSFIRYIGQLRGNRRFAPDEAGVDESLLDGKSRLTREDRNMLHSLVCSLSLDRQWGLDFGVTRSRAWALAQDIRYETNVFVKMEAAW